MKRAEAPLQRAHDEEIISIEGSLFRPRTTGLVVVARTVVGGRIDRLRRPPISLEGVKELADCVVSQYEPCRHEATEPSLRTLLFVSIGPVHSLSRSGRVGTPERA